VAAIPGVSSVGTISRLPLFGGTNTNVWVEGTPPRRNDAEGPLVEVTGVNGDYFEAMGIPVLRGRLLQPGDSASGATNVIINQRFAEVAWPDGRCRVGDSRGTRDPCFTRARAPVGVKERADG
jgi:hypothetical protein